MGRKNIVWLNQAKAQLRAIDQPAALRILRALAHFTATGEGDVKRLQDIEPPEFRLRVGDYRLRFHDDGQTSTSPPSSTAAKPTAEWLPPPD